MGLWCVAWCGLVQACLCAEAFIATFEEEKVPAKKARGRKIGGHGGSPGRNAKSFGEEFEEGGFMAQKGLWHIVKRRMLEDRGGLAKKRRTLAPGMPKPCTKKIFSSWLRVMWKVRKRKERGGTRKPKKKTVQVETERWREKRKG